MGHEETWPTAGERYETGTSTDDDDDDLPIGPASGPSGPHAPPLVTYERQPWERPSLAEASDDEIQQMLEEDEAKRKGHSVAPGKFGAWLWRQRHLKRMTGAELSERSRLSRSWISRIESGASFPGDTDAQRLVLALEESFPIPMALLQEDRLRRQGAMRSTQSRGMSLTTNERRLHGKAQRLRILQVLVGEIITAKQVPTVTSIGIKMDLNSSTMLGHMKKLSDEGFVVWEKRTGQIAQLVITKAGIKRAMLDGWEPDWANADPVRMDLWRRCIRIHDEELVR